MERLRVMPALEGIPIIVVTARDVSLERDSLPGPRRLPEAVRL